MKRIKQEQHIEIQEKSQQLKFRMQTEIQIDKHHALCQASGQLEELDYTKLHFAYSGIRKSQIEPRVLFKVLVCFQYFDRLTLVFHIFVPREQEKGLLHWLLFTEFFDNVEKSASEISVTMAYEITMKSTISTAIIVLESEGRLEERYWNHLRVQNNILDFLYDLWVGSCHSLASDFSTIMKDLVEYDFIITESIMRERMQSA